VTPVATNPSILDSTKKAIGLGADYDVFDPDILMHINSVLETLRQLGIGPAEGFTVEDADTTWTAFVEEPRLLNPAKQYVFYKVRLAFDPPPTSFHIAAIEKQIAELEFRMSIARDEIALTPTVLTPSLPLADTE
jgi:hypothetical protein